MFSKHTPKDAQPASKDKGASVSTQPLLPGRMPSVLSADVVMEGSIRSEGELIIDGTVRGDVIVGRLIVGEQGVVEGSIKTDSVEVRGRVIGNIESDTVSLYESAFVEGDILHARLSIASGAHFQGAVKQKPAAASAPEAEIIDLGSSRAQA